VGRLGSTSGVTDDGRVIALFDDERVFHDDTSVEI